MNTKIVPKNLNLQKGKSGHILIFEYYFWLFKFRKQGRQYVVFHIQSRIQYRKDIQYLMKAEIHKYQYYKSMYEDACRIRWWSTGTWPRSGAAGVNRKSMWQRPYLHKHSATIDTGLVRFVRPPFFIFYTAKVSYDFRVFVWIIITLCSLNGLIDFDSRSVSSQLWKCYVNMYFKN